jgi:hypothetical protein
MSALGQKRTSDWRLLMSALPPKADIAECDWDVRFVPKADIREVVVFGWALPCTAANFAVALHWRTRHGPIGAEHATIAYLGLQLAPQPVHS